MILGVLDDLLERPTGQKVGLLAGLLLAVVFLDWQYFYGPQATRLAQLRKEVSDKRADLDAKRARANSREAAEREVQDLQAELRRAQARLPDQREIADLLSMIAASARESGLDILLFRQKPEVPHDFYAAVPVQMEMRGTYHDVATFLDRVRRLDRMVNVTDIQLRKPRLEGDRMLIEAACNATTFRFLDEVERQRLMQEKQKAEKQQQPKSAGKDL
jgi:type IV pilus assembly protein PilO